MPKYVFDMEAYSYSEGIKAIQLMFEAAKGALDAHDRDIEDAKIEYERHLEAGGSRLGNGKTGIRFGIRSKPTGFSN